MISGIFWVLVVFSTMVFVHEFGHFIVAKANDVKILEFAIGFGPSIVSKKVGETTYAIKVIPLGGYVKMEGEGEGDLGDLSDPRNFQNKTPLQKIAIIAAGPIMNYIMAIILAYILVFTAGIAKVKLSTQVKEVLKGMPAYKAGLKPGDNIISIDGKKIKYGNELVDYIHSHPDKDMVFKIKRGDKILTLNIHSISKKYKINGKEEVFGITGFKPSLRVYFEKPEDTKTYFIYPLKTIAFITIAPIKVIYEVIKGKMSSKKLVQGSAGPIGIGQLIYAFAKQGIAQLVYLSILLNVAIGFFNLIPIPALDGGRIAFLLFTSITGIKVSPEREEFVHFIGFLFLLLLVILVSYQDVVRIVQGKKIF